MFAHEFDNGSMDYNTGADQLRPACRTRGSSSAAAHPAAGLEAVVQGLQGGVSLLPESRPLGARPPGVQGRLDRCRHHWMERVRLTNDELLRALRITYVLW